MPERVLSLGLNCHSTIQNPVPHEETQSPDAASSTLLGAIDLSHCPTTPLAVYLQIHILNRSCAPCLAGVTVLCVDAVSGHWGGVGETATG